mmetsp:Transcript_74515/g.197798  ORF Transcript_74515/g.197798 Transcript_74515/m.197798 type:complete len:210 (+) Transcript_74515:699-1328(+)
MCFSTLGFMRQNQQSACGSITICTSRLLPERPPCRWRARQIDIFLPPTSSMPSSPHAASASSGDENVTQPKPLQGRPSSCSSRARRIFSILPHFFRTLRSESSSMFCGRRAKKTWSGMTCPSSLSPSIWSAPRFRDACESPASSSFMIGKGQGDVFSGLCLRTASGIDGAGHSDRAWTHCLALPLLPTFPSATQRQTWPRVNVWKGGRW